MKKEFCGIGLAGFICSIVCWFVFGWICSIVGLILSSVGLSQCKYQNKSGIGFCIAGIVISIAAILWMILALL